MDTRKEKATQSLEIHIYGVVQGVGFRPFIMKLAETYHIYGEVCNYGGHVIIKATGQKCNLDEFIEKIVIEKPIQSEIIKMDIMNLSYSFEKAFHIISSKGNQNDMVIIPPDLPVCKRCLEEMQSQHNLRYEHPFISCTDCGPRYSIIEKVPYDREATSMKNYTMCQVCNEQYMNKEDRRCHAQTISCLNCGPYLLYKSAHKEEMTNNNAFNNAVDDILNGKIIFIKGIGGYHLCCTPFDNAVVTKLRKIKNRENKPLAVMFLNSSEIEKYCFMTNDEHKLIESKQAPIVLLKRKPSCICNSVYMDSSKLGVFIPYTPLHYMLIKRCGPLVMTSANLSDSPIIKDDDELFKNFEIMRDGVLYHGRRILVALDDSVTQIISGNTQIIRRARGYVPMPIYINNEAKINKKHIIATGSHQKVAFCLEKNNLAYLSQYLGDMDKEENTKRYSETYFHMKNLFAVTPELVVCDMHPQYFTSEFAKQLKIPIIKVQHHHAHIASVMAEHNLREVIGVAFDGTGYGEDGCVWGGEFLVCSDKTYIRVAHLKYVTLLGFDESIKDTKKTASCYLIAANIKDERYDQKLCIIESAIQHKINTYTSSSIGRLFDALSSVLGICDYSHYEGEAAILLEQYAREAQEKNIVPADLSFILSLSEDHHIIIDQIAFFEEVASKIRRNDRESIYTLALGIHRAISKMILDVIEVINGEYNLKKIALSGGVFQNTIILEYTEKLLKEHGYSVYINNAVPANDGGIALGQIYIGMQY